MIPKPEQDALVRSHLNAAEKFAWRTARLSGLSERIDDIRSEAHMGLVIAAQRFDPTRGFTFLTYAAFWMKAQVGRYIDTHRHTVRPSYERDQKIVAVKLRGVESGLLQKLGREPTDDEVAEAIGCRVVLVQKARARFRKHDVRIADTEREPDHHVPVCGAESPEEIATRESTRREFVRAINRAMHRLDAREREVIRRRHLADDPETLAEVGASWGVSRERVRQIESRALKVMRAALLPEQRRLMEVSL